MSIRLLSITDVDELGVDGVFVPFDCTLGLFGDCGIEDCAPLFDEMGLSKISAHSSASTKAERVYNPKDA